MKIAVGDRVRALEDCWMDRDLVGRGSDLCFYREGDTGSVVRFDDLGAWVKWDGNRIDDGVWHANTEILALIEEDTSGIDVLAVMEEAEANTYSALSGRIRDARAAVADLIAALDRVTDRMGVVIETDSDNGSPESPDDVAAYSAGCAALARCRGGAA